MARHAAVDLALVFHTPPRLPDPNRLPNDRWQQLRTQLAQAGFWLADGPVVDTKLAELRGLYEPFVNALGDYFAFALPPIYSETPSVDNWQTSAWTRRTPGLDKLRPEDGEYSTLNKPWTRTEPRSISHAPSAPTKPQFLA
jgi:hypothetical protein